MENIRAISDSQMKQSLYILEKAKAVEHLEIGDEVIIRASGVRSVVDDVILKGLEQGVWLRLSVGVNTFFDSRDLRLLRRPPKAY